jgi:hypothetical protein
MNVDREGEQRLRKIEPTQSLRRRFWIETTLGVVTGALFLLTLAWRDWIETIFGVDPDHGNGSVEWLVVAALALGALALFALARAEWRYTRQLAIEH